MAALLIAMFLPGVLAAAPLRIAYSAISGAMASLWVAQEGGYFKGEGLDTELLYIGGGSLLIQSMLSGDVPFAYGPSVPVINATLRGADLALIGNTGNSLVFSIMSRPEIQQPAHLKGKKVGVTRLGGSTDWALDAALKQWGIERRELLVIQTGGMPEGLAALSSGGLDAVVLSPPSNFRAMLNSAFDGVGAQPGDYYPEALRGDIDGLNERIYHAVNNGVYRAGFATTQQAYEEAAFGVFAMLDELEQRLAHSRYLFGDQPLETDWRLFTTLVRFDVVYVGHFKCNLRRLVDYPNLWGYARDLFQLPRIAPTVNFDHIRRHYYTSHKAINPTGIVPIGPELDFSAPHGRARRGHQTQESIRAD